MTTAEHSIAKQHTNIARRAWAAARIWVAILAPAVYGVALTISLLTDGVPTAHDQLFMWLGLGMAAATISAPRRLVALVLEWAPIFGLLVLYDFLRGAVSVPDAQAHLTTQLDFDRFFTGGELPTVWLQQHLWDPAHLHFYDYGIWAVYLSHFFTVWVIAAIIWRFRHEDFARFAIGAVLLTLMAFATYWLWPAQPPWMAGEAGVIPHVDRIVPTVWGSLGVHDAGSVYGSRDLVNLVAAMPSLHASYPVFIAIWFWNRVPKPVRIVLVAYPLAMAFTLVYGGEHFVLDVVVGWVYAAIAATVAAGVVRALESRREEHHPDRGPRSGVLVHGRTRARGDDI